MKLTVKCIIILLCWIGGKETLGGDSSQPLTFSTLYGTLIVDDPLAIELIQSPAMQRLKKINQYGVNEFVSPSRESFTRFDHSLGVYYLLRRFGASRVEQIAGLLHDVSHTVFSHATDPLFMGGFDQGGYQDMIHQRFLEQHFSEILHKHGFKVEDVLPDRREFDRLERPSGEICGDRLEYNLHAGYLEGVFNESKIEEILKDLSFEKGKWFFRSVPLATEFSQISLHQTLHNWSSPQNILIGSWASEALKIIWNQKAISLPDIEYNFSDEAMWQKLIQYPDPMVQKLAHKIQTVKTQFKVIQGASYHAILKGKFRGINPWVKTAEGLKRLTILNPDYDKAFQKAKQQMAEGWKIIYLSSD
jgi:uncharacterized protein